MAESSSSSIPALAGLAVETVEWLPSGAERGLVRVRGRWLDDGARQPDLPGLALRVRGEEHRFASLPDARFSRDPTSWRGTYLVPAELVATDPEALWLEWPSGARAGLRALSRGVEPPPVPARPPEPPDEGGEVIDRAVLAERRARRAEAAEQQQARVAAEALKAVEVLELRSAELERRLEEATAERDALAGQETETSEHQGALTAALASAAELRARAREWQLRLRTHEVTRAGDAVRLAVLESDRVTMAPALEQARVEATAVRAALDEAQVAATQARAALAETDERFAEARAAWERRRAELDAELTSVRAALDEARALEASVAAAEAQLAVETVARTTLEDELDRERAARAELHGDLELARADNDGLRAELYAAQDAAAAAAGLRAELATLRSAAAVTEDLRSTAQRLQADLEAARRDADDLRAELDAERAARSAEAERIAATGREELERLAREQAAAAAAAQQPPAADATRLVADLDAAAEALRARTPEPDQEPAAPDCEPSVEWSEHLDEEREPVTPGVEPRREGPDAPDVEWGPVERGGGALEPPAPDAEPYAEWEPRQATPPPEPAAAPSLKIVSAATPPPRGLLLGTEKRAYPLLRGAIVKLAHDDPRLAGRVLAALLPAQGTAIGGPLAYDLTITGLGTFAVKIAGGRAEVEPIDRRRGRPHSEFHLTADPLILAELLAGVEHRIGRFFGPARVRGRKRRLQELRALPESTLSLADAARAGAALDPELVYRTFAYAVHPSWTRGHAFTIAQTVAGDPPQTWYLTAQDGAGLRASAIPPDAPPAATVTMTRDVFDRLLRGEPVAHGQRPTVRGDRGAVTLMQSWTERAR